jgi:hypothetical protein
MTSWVLESFDVLTIEYMAMEKRSKMVLTNLALSVIIIVDMSGWARIRHKTRLRENGRQSRMDKKGKERARKEIVGSEN